MGASYSAFNVYNIDVNPASTTIVNGIQIQTYSITKVNHYSQFKSACFVFFRGLKMSTTVLTSLYQLNMTCTDGPSYIFIRL